VNEKQDKLIAKIRALGGEKKEKKELYTKIGAFDKRAGSAMAMPFCLVKTVLLCSLRQASL
jgi:hypothetical protein